MLDKLRENHRGLEIAGDRVAALLDADAPNLEALATARWDLATKIMQHMAMEDRHLFAHLADDQRPEVAALGRQYRADYAQHVASYTEHAKHWTADRVAAEWTSYRAMTREQLRLMKERIAKVERELFPLVDKGAIDTPGAPSISWAREAFAVKDSVAPRR